VSLSDPAGDPFDPMYRDPPEYDPADDAAQYDADVAAESAEDYQRDQMAGPAVPCRTCGFAHLEDDCPRWPENENPDAMLADPWQQYGPPPITDFAADYCDEATS
jgi:hypothetical protein